MSRIWFAQSLDAVATFWRILRRDGVTLAFTTHDRDLWFDGVLHCASPGMLPSAIRRSADLEPDSAEIRGAITHDAIDGADLAAGRFDDARVTVGIVDWESLENAVLYTGSIGAVAQEDGTFSAELVSRKAELWREAAPRTSPTCRAAFCGPGCNLNPARFTRTVHLAALDSAANSVAFAQALDPQRFTGGSLRWLDGPQAGIAMGIVGPDDAGGLMLDVPLGAVRVGTGAFLREGCDRTLETCATRFGNAVNFRGEPHLPGNDMLTRYPGPGA